MTSARSTLARKLVPLIFLICAAAIQLFSPGGTCAVCPVLGMPTQEVVFDDADLELTKAREKANTTQKKYETIKRLSEKGSASQRELRQSDMQRKIALLDYSSLLDPGRKEKNLLLKAEVILRFRIQELEMIKQLYQRGSVSEVTYLRSVAAKDIAVSNFRAAKSANETQRKIQVINAAKSKFDVAQKEFEIASQLFQSSAISQITLDRATSNLKIAAAELEASKKSLGARAVQIKQ